MEKEDHRTRSELINLNWDGGGEKKQNRQLDQIWSHRDGVELNPRALPVRNIGRRLRRLKGRLMTPNSNRLSRGSGANSS